MEFEVTARLPAFVDYGLTLPWMIRKGDYDWVSPIINDRNFPVNPLRRSGKLEIWLIHFKRPVEFKDVKRAFDKMRLRPTELPEVLAIGAQHPDEQRKYPIICLGSTYKDSKGIWRVPCLVSPCGDRRLRTRWLAGNWSGYSRFAAVQK